MIIPLFFSHVDLVSAKNNSISGDVIPKSEKKIIVEDNISEIFLFNCSNQGEIISVSLTKAGIYKFFINASYVPVGNVSTLAPSLSYNLYEKVETYVSAYDKWMTYWRKIDYDYHIIEENESYVFEKFFTFKNPNELLLILSASEIATGSIIANISLDCIVDFSDISTENMIIWNEGPIRYDATKLLIETDGVYEIAINQTARKAEVSIEFLSVDVAIKDMSVGDSVEIYFNDYYAASVEYEGSSQEEVSFKAPKEYIFSSPSGEKNNISFRYVGTGDGVMIYHICLDIYYEDGTGSGDSVFIYKFIYSSEPVYNYTTYIHSKSIYPTVIYTLTDPLYSKNYFSEESYGNYSLRRILYLRQGEYYLILNRDLSAEIIVNISVEAIDCMVLVPNQSLAIKFNKDEMEAKYVFLQNYDSLHLYRLQINKASGNGWNITGYLGIDESEDILEYSDISNETKQIDDLVFIEQKEMPINMTTGCNIRENTKLYMVEITENKTGVNRYYRSLSLYEPPILKIVPEKADSGSDEFVVNISFSEDGEIVTIVDNAEISVGFPHGSKSMYAILRFDMEIGKKYVFSIEPTGIADSHGTIFAYIVVPDMNDWINQILTTYKSEYYNSIYEPPMILESTTTYKEIMSYIVISVTSITGIKIRMKIHQAIDLSEEDNLVFDSDITLYLLKTKMVKDHTYRYEAKIDNPESAAIILFYTQDGLWPFYIEMDNNKYYSYWSIYTPYMLLTGREVYNIVPKINGEVFIVVSKYMYYYSYEDIFSVTIWLTDITEQQTIRNILIGVGIGLAPTVFLIFMLYRRRKE